MEIEKYALILDGKEFAPSFDGGLRLFNSIEDAQVGRAATAEPDRFVITKVFITSAFTRMRKKTHTCDARRMTRKALNELLKLYANGAYWYGEETGDYGYPDPEIHKEVEAKIWNAISPNKVDTPDRQGLRPSGR